MNSVYISIRRADSVPPGKHCVLDVLPRTGQKGRSFRTDLSAPLVVVGWSGGGGDEEGRKEEVGGGGGERKVRGEEVGSEGWGRGWGVGTRRV